ncbi:kinase-like domain-containing protein [Xylaria palmicola]|nr:kinase-like domain-containing protein [Xylaria palmicola]
MPYFPSGSINQAGVCDESRLVTAFGQLLDCLSFLHARGVTHRDIKPDNVLVELTPHFKVVLTDFGLSRAVTATTWLNSFCGTPLYMAPEVFPFTNSTYGPPADFWSLGVVALEWLYGIPATAKCPASRSAPGTAFQNQWFTWSHNWFARLIAHLRDQEDRVDIDLLQRMLATDQTKRWTANWCLVTGLERGLFKRRLVDGLVTWGLDGEEEANANLAGGDEVLSPESSSEAT